MRHPWCHARTALAYELYTLAARRPEFRSITEQWMLASRQALRRHLTAAVARNLDAYIEGDTFLVGAGCLTNYRGGQPG